MKYRISPSEITPKEVYLSRRNFLRAAGVLAGSLALSACTPGSMSPSVDPTPESDLTDVPNTFEQITQYNNYYEFTTDKERVANLAKRFPTSPWTIEVSGLVNKPGKIDVEDLIKKNQPEERVYRMRCVEAWSMVIPWVGFPLSKLLMDVEPTSAAKFVRFESILDPEKLPGQKQPYYPWPYQEGLRLDEGMNDLTLLATGLYGGELPAQNGGGLRLVVPWKYGFKSIKAVVKIELTAEQPETMWNRIAPDEYGFFANVNPNVDHPRWSQRTERRIGEFERRDTQLFNGYAEQVASMYSDLDLSIYY